MSTTAPDDLQPGQIRALIVGVEDYAAGPKWKLDGPAEDALRFTRWLLARNVPPTQVHLFLSPLPGKVPDLPDGIAAAPPPTRAALEAVLENDLRQSPPRLFYFFWSGHGLIKLDQTRRLITSDATDDNIRNLDLNEVFAYLRTTAIAGAGGAGLAHQVFFIDTCADFAELRGAKGVADKLPDHALPKGDPVASRSQFLLLAARPGETAKNLTAERTGLFSRELMKLLDREAADCLLPDLRRLTSELEQVFERLGAAKQATQRPAYLWLHDWSGSENHTGQPPDDRSAIRPQTSLAKFLDEVAPSPTISREERARLCEITATSRPPVPDAVTTAAFQLAHPAATRLPTFVQGMEKFRWCAYELGELPPAVLFKFIALCRPHLKGRGVAKSVADWETTVAARLKLDLAAIGAEVEKLTPAMERVRDAAQVLQIVVEPLPGPGGKDRFQMHVGRLVTEPELAVELLGSSEELAADRDQLGALLLPLFHRALDRGVETNDLRIEVVLPRDLLPGGADDWKVQQGARRDPVGICHGTALRSFERAYATELAARDPERDYRPAVDAQQEKWKLVAGYLQPEAIAWAADSKHFGDDFYLELKSPEVVAMAAVGLEVPVASGVDPAEDLISAGIPVAVWLHDHQGDWNVTRAALEEQFAKIAPADWPKRALVLRCQPPAKRLIPCKRLTVLHDDPTRPTLRLPSRADAALEEPKLTVP